MAHAETLKKCGTCSIDKPLSDYRRQRGGLHGRQGSCRQCSDAYMERYRERARAQRLAYNREYYGGERGKEAIARYKRRFPAKDLARRKMWNAIARGALVKPDACEDCGRSVRLDGHHDDYAKPLDVRWLCRKCHKLWHKIHGEGRNANMPATVGTRSTQRRRISERRIKVKALSKHRLSTAAIAARLGVSAWTVRDDLKQMETA